MVYGRFAVESEKGKVVIAREEGTGHGTIEKERRKAAERSHRRPAVSPANSVGSSLANPGISTSMCVYAPPTCPSYPSTMGSTYVAHTSRAMCVLPANKRRYADLFFVRWIESTRRKNRSSSLLPTLRVTWKLPANIFFANKR